MIIRLVMIMMLSATLVAVDVKADTVEPELEYELGRSNRYFVKGRSDLSLYLPVLDFNFNAACSNWDVGATAKNILNDLDSQLNRVHRNLVNSVQGFITQMPMLLLQRYQPDIYEYLNKTLGDAEDIFNMSVKSCQQMTDRFKRSSDLGVLADYSQYVSISNMASDDDQEKDITGAMNETDEDPGKEGVAGLNEQCAGEDMDMCNPGKDATYAGFSAHSENQDPPQNEEDVTDSDPWVWHLWQSKEDAYDWISKVVGEVKYGICNNCQKLETSPGVGTYDEIASTASEIFQNLMEMAESSNIPSTNQLIKVSAYDMLIDENVILALKSERTHRNLFATRISEDIALMRTVDKLLAARRLLIAGRGHPKISQVQKNTEIISKKIEMISNEIGLLKEELELKKASRGDTVVRLLNRHSERVRRGSHVPEKGDSELTERIRRINGG